MRYSTIDSDFGIAQLLDIKSQFVPLVAEASSNAEEQSRMGCLQHLHCFRSPSRGDNRVGHPNSFNMIIQQHRIEEDPYIY